MPVGEVQFVKPAPLTVFKNLKKPVELFED